jgi:acetyl/propionyl-CoA carboxylase alpha subunit
MFKKILIANRGEIAVRIIRTCREMGIRTATVYSTADRLSPHVLISDEAFYIGEPPPIQSYLNQREIIQIAKSRGCEAIHPGYGFLAENPDFARAVTESGIVFIGPPEGTIRLMGDKIAARESVSRAGVPVVPGSSKPLSSEKELF